MGTSVRTVTNIVTPRRLGPDDHLSPGQHFFFYHLVRLRFSLFAFLLRAKLGTQVRRVAAGEEFGFGTKYLALGV